MSLMSGSCAKGFYSNRIQIVANATKLIGLIGYKFWKNSMHILTEFCMQRVEKVWNRFL